MLCNIIGPEKPTTLVNTDVVKVITAVGFLKEPTVHFLLLFFFQQQFLYCWD